MSNGISIILCCYNSASRIEYTLRHIAAQSFPTEIAAEVILVDNNSTDNTSDLATRVWDDMGFNVSFSFRLLNEDKQGLVYARITGVKAAQYNYIVFCDDDNWLAPDYCSRVMQFFDDNPDFGLLGGYCNAISSVPLPEWFHAKRNAYACGQQYYFSGDVTGKAFLWGAGLASRRELLLVVYAPEIPVVLTGRKGNELISGDDDEINGRIWLLGYKTWYEESLVLKHFIDPKRLYIEYPNEIIRNFSAQGSVRGAYFRLFRILRMNVAMRSIKFLSALVNWAFAFCIGNESAKKIAANYIYLATGWNWFSDPVSVSVYDFHKYYGCSSH